LRGVFKVTSKQISVALELALDERIVIIGFEDASRAAANPYKPADLALPS